jgi:hypothetical protein
MQFILIEPDIKRLGWGIVKFCDLMQVSIRIKLEIKEYLYELTSILRMLK